MEAGVFALSRLRIRQQMRAGPPLGPGAARLPGKPGKFPLDHPGGQHRRQFLYPGLAGRAACTACWAIIASGSSLVFCAGGVPVLRPVRFAAQNDVPGLPEPLCFCWRGPFGAVHLALRPLVALVEWCSGLLLRWRGGKVFTGHLFGNREELRLVMQESAQAFTSEERTMINRVLDLQTLTVRQVMKPLAQAVTVPAQLPVSGALKLAAGTQLHAACRSGTPATASRASSACSA